MFTSSFKMFSTLSILGAGVCFNSTTAFALPSKRGNAALPKEVVNQIAADPTLNGVQVLPDHDANVKVFYVSPANRKPQIGNFISNANPDCSTIKKMYDMTFMLPAYNTPDDLMKVAQDPNAAVSAFFFLHFAGSVRQGDVLNQIQQNFNNTQNLLNQNRPAYDRYLGAQVKWTDAQALVLSVKGDIQHLDDVIKQAQDQFMMAQDDTARQAARAALDAAILQKQTQYPKLYLKLNQVQNLETDARNEFVAAHDGVASLLQNLKQSNDSLDFNTKLFDARRKVALDEYTMDLQTLELRESRTIGSANVAVQVWGDEATKVDSIIKNYGGAGLAGYSVQRLSIQNVTLDGRYWESKTQTADGSGTGIGNGKIDQTTTSSDLTVGDTTKVDSPYRDQDGKPIQMLVKTLGQRDSFSLSIPISAGSYCMSQGKADEDRIEFEVNENGTTQKNVMTIRRYVPRSEPVLKPSFALNYEYFVKAEPMDVTCHLNQDTFFKSIQDSGSSGFLFWRHSWSDNDLTQAQSEGISCKVNSSPIGDDINLQRQMESDIVESFSKDLAAEAILLRAKEWKVTQADVALPAPSQGFKMIGTGVLAICGGNPYCMVGGIVLKSIEELFGSQTASGNNTYHYSTDLTRNFNYDGFTVDRASVIVDAEIR